MQNIQIYKDLIVQIKHKLITTISETTDLWSHCHLIQADPIPIPLNYAPEKNKNKNKTKTHDFLFQCLSNPVWMIEKIKIQ